jgi:hypothetical protein
MAEQDQTKPDTGTACAVTLRRVMPAALAARRDPWDVAEQLAAYHGCEAAPLIAANALRWRAAHDFARMGRRDLACALVARELMIDCRAIDRGAVA